MSQKEPKKKYDPPEIEVKPHKLLDKKKEAEEVRVLARFLYEVYRKKKSKKLV